MHRVTPEELTHMNRESLRCAAELADARVNVMRTACLVVIMAQGLRYTANVDAVVLSACVQMQSVPALQLAQDMLGLPVTSTSACTVRNMLDLLGLPFATPGFGQVLMD